MSQPKMNKHKSIRQRLQSRISLRRNGIREAESCLAHLNSMCYRLYGQELLDLREDICYHKEYLKSERDSQQLDKQLYARLVNDERWERQWEGSMQALTIQGVFNAH